MQLLKIFKADLNAIRKSHVKNLITVAMADGELDGNEWGLLVDIAKTLGISEAEIKAIQENPESINFTPPKRYNDKVQQISDLVAVMTIDGHISQRELELCKKISLKLDILPRMVDDIVNDLLAS
jgi:uncharacterized tellurite resistance protein B-like protein